jgi:hypothetical protein
MTDSYYRFPKEVYTDQYEPKIFYEKNPIKAEQNDTKINYLAPKVGKIRKEPSIDLEYIEKEWQNGVKNSKDGYNSNPFSNMRNLRSVYREPDLNTPLPMYVPSDKIFLNTPNGIARQWRLFLKNQGLRKSKKKSKKQSDTGGLPAGDASDSDGDALNEDEDVSNADTIFTKGSGEKEVSDDYFNLPSSYDTNGETDTQQTTDGEY